MRVDEGLQPLLARLRGLHGRIVDDRPPDLLAVASQARLQRCRELRVDRRARGRSPACFPRNPAALRWRAPIPAGAVGDGRVVEDLLQESLLPGVELRRGRQHLRVARLGQIEPDRRQLFDGRHLLAAPQFVDERGDVARDRRGMVLPVPRDDGCVHHLHGNLLAAERDLAARRLVQRLDEDAAQFRIGLVAGPVSRAAVDEVL